MCRSSTGSHSNGEEREDTRRAGRYCCSMCCRAVALTHHTHSHESEATVAAQLVQIVLRRPLRQWNLIHSGVTWHSSETRQDDGGASIWWERCWMC